MIRVVTVDDHAIVREGIVLFLSSYSEFDVVGQADNAQVLFDNLPSWQPDVVLMDLHLSDKINGVEATQELLQQKPNTKVIILTSYHQDDYVFPAFNAGALSYLLKSTSPQELANAIIKAHDGQPVFSDVVANKLLSLATGKTKQNLLIELSEREMQILKLIAKGMNNAEISQALFIHIKTVKSHVSNILQKLQLRDRTQVAIHAWKSGLMKE
ncbi:response regulator transcription factor [Thalassotalea ganghwensis]